MNLAKLLEELERYSEELGRTGTLVVGSIDAIGASRRSLSSFDSKDTAGIDGSLEHAIGELSDVARSLIPSMRRTLNDFGSLIRQ